jgi:hypothetical protein
MLPFEWGALFSPTSRRGRFTAKYVNHTKDVMDCAGRAQRRQRIQNVLQMENPRACESGVALRFPPQSKASQGLLMISA